MMPHILVDAPGVLTRLAESLRAEVLPRVEESYVVAQVESVAQALENLANRVAWAPGLIEGELAVALSVVAAMGGTVDDPDPAPASQPESLALLGAVRQQVALLAASPATDSGGLCVALDILAESRPADRLAGGDLPTANS